MKKTIILILIIIVLIAYFSAVEEFRQISKIHSLTNTAEVTVSLKEIKQLWRNLNNPNITIKNIFEFLRENNIASIIVEEESLDDWNKLGFLSIASGPEILDAFRVQGIINLYIWEQIKDKEISPVHTYIFTDNSVVFENLKLILEENFKDKFKVYSYEQKVFDGQITHNYIIEVFVLKEGITNLKTGLNINDINIIKLSGLDIYYKLSSKITPRVMTILDEYSGFISGIIISDNLNYNLKALSGKNFPVILPDSEKIPILTSEKLLKMKDIYLTDSVEEIFHDVKFDNTRILKFNITQKTGDMIFASFQNFLIDLQKYFSQKDINIGRANTISIIRTTNIKVFILFLGTVSLILLLFNFATKYSLSYLSAIVSAVFLLGIYIVFKAHAVHFKILNIILITISIPALSILIFETPKIRTVKASELIRLIAVLFLGVNLITIAGGIYAKGFLNDTNFIYSSHMLKEILLSVFYIGPLLVAYLLYINISQWGNFGQILEKQLKYKHILISVIVAAVFYYSASAIKYFYAGDMRFISLFIISGNIMLIISLFLIFQEKIKFVVPLILFGSLSQTLQLIMFLNVTPPFTVIAKTILYNLILSLLGGIIIIIIILIGISVKNKRMAFLND